MFAFVLVPFYEWVSWAVCFASATSLTQFPNPDTTPRETVRERERERERERVTERKRVP